MDAGESPNSVGERGLTPAMICQYKGHLATFLVLVERGADLTMVDDDGLNMLHFAALRGDVDSIKWLLSNTPLNVDSITNNCVAPLSCALLKSRYEAAKLLVENGANLWAKVNDKGRAAIDIAVQDDLTVILGPQLLAYAKSLKYESVKQLLLLSASYSRSINEENAAQLQSLLLASKVLANPQLIRVIACFFIPSNIITRDISIPSVPDAVKVRVEAELAAALAASSLE
jgi:hypothetical protein